MTRAPRGQLAVAIGLFAIGVLIFAGAFFLPAGGGYAQVGPGVVPKVVGVGLIVLAGFLFREALTGGFRGVDEEAEKHLPMHWGYFAWVSGGIIAYGLLVELLGFVIASTVLFVMVCCGFNSRRWTLNIVAGIALAIFVFVLFNYGLGLNLPAGITAPLLPK
jgi:putative tricarboxylic transport membrane protein